MTDLTALSDDDLLKLYHNTDAAAAMPALIATESGGRPGVLGPPTKYGRAQGETQMLPATAQATAAKLNLPWRPELMTGTTPEAAEYQRQLGQGYLQEGIDKTGSVEDGLRYYHGGPDRRLWGPKTEDYVQKVSARMNGPQAAPEPPQDLSHISDADLLAMYGQPVVKSAGPAATAARAKLPQLPVKPPTAPSRPIFDPAGDWSSAVRTFADGIQADKAALDQRGGKMPANPIEALKETLAAQGRTLGHVADAVAIPLAQINGPIQRGIAEPYGALMSKVLPKTNPADWAGSMMTALSAAGPEIGPTGLPKVLIGPKAVLPKLPKGGPVTLEALKTAKTAAYNAADKAGVRYTPEAFDGLVTSIQKDVADANLNPLIHPKAAAMVDSLDKMRGMSPTLTELDQLRQYVQRDVAGSSDPAEGFFGGKMKRQIDQFIDNAGPEHVASGSAADAASLIKNARDLNTRVRKTEAITDAVDSAKLRASSTGSGGNVDNAVRQNLRRVLENTPNFTPDEEAALRSAISGTPAQNMLRLIGKLSPQGSGLMTMMNLGLAAKTGGIGALPAAAGIASKVAADAMTAGKVKSVLGIIANDATKPAQLQALQAELASAAPTDTAAAALRRAIAARLVRATIATNTISGAPRRYAGAR